MKRLLHTPLALLVWRIALLYAALMLCRAAFWVYNAALLGPPVWSELGQLVAGSLKFDTASVVYADGVFILLSLLPLHLRERRWYRGMLFWYYVIVNAVLIAAANLADTVYFRYTQKRFTADEIFFADNDNSLQLVGKFMAENWYLVLLWIALTALLAWGYRRRVREESIFSRGWAYYIGNTVIFAAAAGLSVAGMRGGMTRMTRPITLSNAMLYTADSGKANLILSNPFCILRTIGNAGSVKYRKYFTPGGIAPALHARAPARRQRSGRSHGPQRDDFHHGEHVGRALRVPPSGTLRRPPGKRLHAVPRFTDAQWPDIQTDVRQRLAFDPGHALGAGKHPLVPHAVRTDAPIVG